MLSIEDKIKQLLFIKVDLDDENLDPNTIDVGGVMLRPSSHTQLSDYMKKVDEFHTRPFISANIEYGLDGILKEHDPIATPFQLGKCDDDTAREFNRYVANGLEKIGVNMTFSPVVDISLLDNNPITNTRSYGETKDIVLKRSLDFVSELTSHNVLATIKHFPGDGTTEFDQHVTHVINGMDKETWLETYGHIYQTHIDRNVPAIMLGHINLEWLDKDGPVASQSKKLVDYLRKDMGFDNLLITDSTLMAGYTAKVSRYEAMLNTLLAGVDMILFSRDYHEDMEMILDMVHTGKLPVELIDEKIERISKVKKMITGGKSEGDVLDSDRIRTKVAEQSLSYHNESGLLPFKAQSNVLVIPYIRTKHDYFKEFVDGLAEDFNVILNDYQDHQFCLKENSLSIKEFKGKYDYVIYYVDYMPLSNRNHIRHEYIAANGVDTPWFVNEVDTIVVAPNNPYVLKEFNMIDTTISTYGNNAAVIKEILKLIKGGV